MAEYVLACFYNFARELHHAYHDRERHRFDHRSYRPIVLDGKTVCVVGAGGIGREVGQLCASVGMRVIGIRRSVTPGGTLPPGFTRLESADRLHALLAESDCVAVCCQWTPETTKLIGREAFAAMKPGTILVNVARGEIIDEEALVVALNQGKLRGVGLRIRMRHHRRRLLVASPHAELEARAGAAAGRAAHHEEGSPEGRAEKSMTAGGQPLRLSLGSSLPSRPTNCLSPARS